MTIETLDLSKIPFVHF